MQDYFQDVSWNAILFGKAWRDAHLPVWAAALVALSAGTTGGALNAMLITRLRLPPLIVTLATFSLFRGLAEAITHGVDTFTGFPESFLRLGQEQPQLLQRIQRKPFEDIAARKNRAFHVSEASFKLRVCRA